MAVFFDIDQLPTFNNTVLTIGTFDGVHLGHRVILNEVVKHAKAVNGESVLITFEPHPRKLLFPDQSLKLLTPLHEKIELIQQAGIQHVVVAPFTKTFSELTAQEYIENFLVKYFHPESIIIGYDHHFGHDRRGDIHLLRTYEAKHQFNVVEIPAQLIDQAAVSSTKIRHALEQGHVHDATHMLGRDYNIKGTVIKGKQLGRTLGYPTANIMPDDKDQLIPAVGIYAVKVNTKGQEYGGMMSIGYNPTVTNEKTIKIEVNIFDFDEEIYNEEIAVAFIARLRNEEKFDGLDSLKEQLHADKEQSLKILSAN